MLQWINSLVVSAVKRCEVILDIRSQRLIALPRPIVAGLDECDEDLCVDHIARDIYISLSISAHTRCVTLQRTISTKSTPFSNSTHGSKSANASGVFPNMYYPSTHHGTNRDPGEYPKYTRIDGQSRCDLHFNTQE